MKNDYRHYEALWRYYNLRCTEREICINLHCRGDTLSQLEARQDNLARHQISIRRFLERNHTALTHRSYTA